MKKNERRRDAAAPLSPTSATTSATKNGPRYFRSFFEFGLAATLVPALLTAPEGANREGDFLPVAFPFFVFVVLAELWALRFPIATRSQNASKTTPSNAKPSVDSPSQTIAKKGFSFWRIADFSLASFLFFATISYLALIVGKTGNVRTASNSFWCFATPTLLYFFVRRFRSLFTNRLTTGLCILLIICSTVESLYSVYSIAVDAPRLRAEYRVNPERMLRENGLDFAAGSQERLLFEKRLLESSEPTGSFALANTLAGLLAPTLVLAFVGSFALLRRRSKNSFRKRRVFLDATIGAIWCVALIFCSFTLIATKSRAGFLAFLFGIAFLGAASTISAIRSGRGFPRRIALGAVAAILASGAILGGALAFNVVDREVFAEAGKSLGYRLDYWRASVAIVRDFPFLGIGPGEFQNVYPQYVAPTASEFVADPHNFAFELTTLFGVPAFAAFFIFGVATLFATFRPQKQFDDESQLVENKMFPVSSNVPLLVGSIAGVFLAFFCALFQSVPLDATFLALALGVFLVVFPCALQLFRDRSFANVALAAAFVALLLNLCAAGGIGYPAISYPLFLLAAIIANRCEKTSYSFSKTVETNAISGVKKATPLVLTALVAIVFYETALLPRSNAWLFSLRLQTPTGAAFYADAFRSGAPERIDDESFAVVAQFYFFAAQEYFDRPTAPNRERWEKMREQATQISPNSASSRENLGDFDFRLFNQDRTRREFLDSAREFYDAAVEKSPTDVRKREKLVRVCRTSGDVETARTQAQKALELDATTTHLDRKLSDESRAELTRFLDGEQAQ